MYFKHSQVKEKTFYFRVNILVISLIKAIIKATFLNM